MTSTPLTPKRLLSAGVLLVVAVVGQMLGLYTPEGATDSGSSSRSGTGASVGAANSTAGEGAATIAAAFAAQRSGFMVEVEAEVDRTLPDDNEGSRHQRFIVRLSDGATVLVAHNIDLAPYVPLERGDRVRIYGQYEHNEQGGVLHWTHHDPDGRHEEGWIEHNGERYE